MGKTNLTLDLTVDVRTDYLRGLNISELSEKYKLSVPIITHVLNGDDRISRRLAEEGIQKYVKGNRCDCPNQGQCFVIDFFSAWLC